MSASWGRRALVRILGWLVYIEGRIVLTIGPTWLTVMASSGIGSCHWSPAYTLAKRFQSVCWGSMTFRAQETFAL